MKNKKTLVGIVLLIVVLALGIGYAAITSSLTISGTATATANAENFKVVFTGETSEVSEGVTATATNGATTATLNVTGLTKVGDSKTATYTIQNNSAGLNALVDVTTEEITGVGGFFSIDASVANNTTELEPEGKTTVTVTVTLDKTPIEDVNGTINVKLGATAVLAD